MVNLMFDRGYGYVGLHPFPSGDGGDNAYNQFSVTHIKETLKVGGVSCGNQGTEHSFSN